MVWISRHIWGRKLVPKQKIGTVLPLDPITPSPCCPIPVRKSSRRQDAILDQFLSKGINSLTARRNRARECGARKEKLVRESAGAVGAIVLIFIFALQNLGARVLASDALSWCALVSVVHCVIARASIVDHALSVKYSDRSDAHKFSHKFLYVNAFQLLVPANVC